MHPRPLFVNMSPVEQLRAMASVAIQLPNAVLRRDLHSVQAVAEHNVHQPVVLVHGYAGTDGVWTEARRALRDAGFGHLVSLSYNSFATDPVHVARELAERALSAMAATGSSGVHLVGHSLGGLIVRRALGDSPALAGVTTTAVTIASPHRGAPLARIAPGRCARIMHPDPRPTRGLQLRRVRWLAYYSDADRIVPTVSARLSHPATNVLIPGCGHLTICRDARLIRSLVSELIRTESSSAPSALSAAAA